jgi:hypothetical protein
VNLSERRYLRVALGNAAWMLGYVREEKFDRLVDPLKMIEPYVATLS